MPAHTVAERLKNRQKKKKKKPVPFDGELLLGHKGESFASQGLGKFVKEIVRVGLWKHPVTGQEVNFDRARLNRICNNSNRYLDCGNKIPFPSGHSFKNEDNMGWWTGPFMVENDKLYGVVSPTDPGAAQRIKDGTLDAVSARIDMTVDAKGNEFEDCLIHVCGTNYPVLTEQKDFVQLSTEGGETREVPLLLLEDKPRKEEEKKECSVELSTLADALRPSAPTPTSGSLGAALERMSLQSEPFEQ